MSLKTTTFNASKLYSFKRDISKTNIRKAKAGLSLAGINIVVYKRKAREPTNIIRSNGCMLLAAKGKIGHRETSCFPKNQNWPHIEFEISHLLAK